MTNELSISNTILFLTRYLSNADTKEPQVGLCNDGGIAFTLHTSPPIMGDIKGDRYSVESELGELEGSLPADTELLMSFVSSHSEEAYLAHRRDENQNLFLASEKAGLLVDGKYYVAHGKMHGPFDSVKSAIASVFAEASSADVNAAFIDKAGILPVCRI